MKCGTKRGKKALSVVGTTNGARGEAIEKLNNVHTLMLEISSLLYDIKGVEYGGRADRGGDPESVAGYADLVLAEAGRKFETALLELGLWDGSNAFYCERDIDFQNLRGKKEVVKEVAHG